jgi:hypothetical protein
MASGLSSVTARAKPFRGVRQRAFLQVLLAAGALALPRPGFAEFPKYLPDGCNFIVAVNFAEMHDSPQYQKLRADIADFAPGESSFQEEVLIGLAPSIVAQITLSSDLTAPGDGSGPLVSVRTRIPVSAAGIRAARKLPAYMKDFSYREVKVGEKVIYENSYAWTEGGQKMSRGAFAVVEDNLVLVGPNAEYLRKVMARGKSLELSPELQSAVRSTDFAKTLAYAIDLKAAVNETFTREFTREIAPVFGGAIDIEFVKKLDGLCFDATLTGPGAVVRGSLIAKDAGTAGDVKKVVEAAQVAMSGMLRKLPRAPKEVADAIDAVKFSVAGAKVSATGEVKAAALVQWIEDEYKYQKGLQEERLKAIPARPPTKATETKPAE